MLANDKNKDKDVSTKLPQLAEGELEYEVEKKVETKMDVGASVAETKDSVILDIDEELSNEKEKKKVKAEEKIEPMRPGLGKVGTNKKSVATEVPSTPKPANAAQASGSFSLLPLDEEELLYQDLPKAIRKLFYTFLTGALLILGSWYGLSSFLSTYALEANGLQDELRTIGSERLRYKITDADLNFTFQYYSVVKSLLENHVTWSKFFTLLEKYTVPEVYYTNFSVNAVTDTHLSFQVIAYDLKSALKQYLVLKKYAEEFCTNVEMTNLNVSGLGSEEGDTTVTYSLSFELVPNLFYVDKKE
jgi:hypothetical protein